MRAKCQQTKSQVAKRPHNLTPSGSASLLHFKQLLGSLPERMLCAYQTLRSKWKTPKCKTQNVNANANMKAKANAKSKTNADSCAIQSCCSCQVASSSSSPSSLSQWHLSIYLIVDFCRTSTNDFLAKFVFCAQFMRLVCHSAVAVRETRPQQCLEKSKEREKSWKGRGERSETYRLANRCCYTFLMEMWAIPTSVRLRLIASCAVYSAQIN